MNDPNLADLLPSWLVALRAEQKAAEGELDHGDLFGLALPKVDTKITDPLTELELRDLIKACGGTGFLDRRDEAIVRLMAETGMRAGECAALALADVDVVRGVAAGAAARAARAGSCRSGRRPPPPTRRDGCGWATCERLGTGWWSPPRWLIWPR